MIRFLIAAVATFAGLLILEPFLFWLAQLLGFYTIVGERQCKVYMLFGKVVGELDDPGFHFLWPKLGMRALIVNLFGKCYSIDLSLD